ncbi:MAG: Gp15 family bacteriophage protein [Clostridium sp.]
METLLDYSPDKVKYAGRYYRVNTAYDVVLLTQRLYEEEILNTGDKIKQALRMLVKSKFFLWLLSPTEQVELLEKITKEKIAAPKCSQSSGERLIDFFQDGGYIYSSFRQAYGIDLMKERGRLSWKRFIDLLEGLPEKTKIKEVMRIRAMELPEPTRYNQKERRNIMELKAYYGLSAKSGGGQNGLNMLFSTLARMAQ